MSFGGHVLDMISRIKANQALKNARHDRHRRVIEIHESHASYNNLGTAGHPIIPNEKLDEVKRDIRAKLVVQKRREVVATIVVMLVLAISLAAFAFWVLK